MHGEGRVEKMQATEWIVNGIPEGVRAGSGDDLPFILRVLLAQRGITEEDELDAFLRPRLQNLGDPFELPEMEVAVEAS